MKKIILILLLSLITFGCTDNNMTNIETPQEEEKNNYILGSDNDVYRINILTQNHEFPTSLDTYIDGKLMITEQNTKNVIHDATEMKIRVRGNSTSAPDKKPYKIKFNKAQSLFGLKAAKDWVLLSNYFDKSNIRNYLAYTLANKLDNLNYQPSSIFVDVYINNEYLGLYTLSEQVEANRGRVDIEDDFNEDGISSFLIEADIRAIDEYKGYENLCYIPLEGYALKFEYPDCDDYIEALLTDDTSFINSYKKNIEWANNFLNNLTAELKTNDFDSFSKYIDIESFIDYYLVQEFFKNVDVASTSQFYYIKQTENPKLACGPVWDFDISGGVVDDSQGDGYVYYHNTKLYVKEVDPFYKYLFKNDEFNKMVKNRYNEVRDNLLEVFNQILELESVLEKAQARNLKRWSLPTQRKYWIEVYAMSNTYYSLKTINEHYKYLSDFLMERLILLDYYYM